MDKVKQSLKNLSLRKSIALYLILSVVVASILIVATTRLCQISKSNIENAYPQSGERYYLTNEGGERLGDGVIISNEVFEYTEKDEQTLIALNLLETISPPIIIALCMLTAVFIFYRNKLKTPLAILDKASERIADNDLDFNIGYLSNDEMGKLCASFDKMRASLSASNKRMWRQMEQRKQLNAAFAHDLRTPLTVLKGYSEILEHGGENQTIRDTAATMTKHIGRLERYTESMSNLQKLEDMTPNYKSVDLSRFLQSAQQTAAIICEKAAKHLVFGAQQETAAAELDDEMILTVIENLVSNAARYADNEITVAIVVTRECFTLTVNDNGGGFSSKSVRRATEPYYTGDTDRANHFGLGLYICETLCRHHNGELHFGNSEQGAFVTASFKTKIVV